MNYLVLFAILDFFNPFGLDGFVMTKCWFLSLLIAYKRSSEQSKITKEAWYFTLPLMTILISKDWSTTIIGSELMGFNGLIQIFIYMELFSMTVNSFGTFVRPIALFIVPMVTYAIFQRLGYDYFHPTWAIPYHRAVSTQGNPVFLSMTIGMLFPLVRAFFIESKEWYYSGLEFLMCIGLWAAGSKSGLVAAVVGLFVFSISGMRK